MTEQNALRYWKEGAADALDTAEKLFDDYKQTFYKKATITYASKWLVMGKNLYQKFLLLI